MQKIIPSGTFPLTKAIRTLEGILVVVFNLAMLIVPIVSSALSAATAAKYAFFINGILVVSRSGLKALAAFSPSETVQGERIVQKLKDSGVLPDVEAIAGEVTKQLSEKGFAPGQLVNDAVQDEPDIGRLVNDAEEMGSAPPFIPESATKGEPPPQSLTANVGTSAPPSTGASAPPSTGA